MASSVQDALSKWCVLEDLSTSVWATNEDTFKLLKKELPPPSDVSLDVIIRRSESFPIKFPTKTVRCKELQKLVSKNSLEKNINSVYPIIHERVLQQIARFLLLKKGPAGSKVEQKFYKDMDIISFVDRLLMKRAVKFVGSKDRYMLLNGVKGIGSRTWQTIGTDTEKPPLILENCLSYDEIKLAAFLSVSSYTHFLNVGDRRNKGIYSKEREKIEDEGIITGLIGPRFQRVGLMDYQDIIYDGKQPDTQSLVKDFYEEEYVNYSELKKLVKNSGRFIEYKPGRFFDNVVYSKRIAVSFDTLVHEANARAKDAGKMAFVHVVGIGLGLWKVSQHQNKLFMDICTRRIENLGNYLHNISDVCFSYIKTAENGNYKHGDVIPIEGHPNGGVKIHIYNREPHQKLDGPDEGKLSVVSYAWDGNALPGNEFWTGSLHTSGDPAAAASTQIAELHNPHINPKACGHNLKVVTPRGVLSLKDYICEAEAAVKANK